VILTNENYFSTEASMEYMSVSQFKAFESCEAAALAEAKGEYKREETTSLLVGKYVDAHFEGTLDVFKAQHPDIFTKSGTLKSDYRRAEEIISRIESDPAFMDMLSGEKQVIKTGVIEGIPVKIKMDAYFPGEKIVDLKIMKDFSPIWKDGQKMPWFAAWGYDLQGAIYQEIEGNKLPFYLAAASKEPVTDIQGLHIPQEYLDERMEYFRGMLPRYAAIKRGEIEPTRCEHCDYCKSTKKFHVVDASDLYYDMED
jgi:hypothetical protein